MNMLISFVKKNKITFCFIATSILILAVSGILGMIVHFGKNSLADQNLAARWSDKKKFSQVSIFYDESVTPDSDYIDEMRSKLQVSVDDAEYKDVKGRTFIDAYSGNAVRTFEGAKTGSFNVICVGGDFFEFHPIPLIRGSYFSDNSCDFIIVDEKVAWQLFGSNDIIGMTVYVDMIPFTVSGVCPNDSEEWNLLTGDDTPVVYMPYHGAANTGETPAISCYEVLMPGPVKNYALESVKKANERYVEQSIALDNSARFGYTSLYDVCKDRKYRSIRTDGIKFPAWENEARIKEYEIAPVALWQTILLSVLAAFWIVWVIVFLVRHKLTWQSIELFWEKLRTIKGGHTNG